MRVATYRGYQAGQNHYNFNPRHPCGWRQEGLLLEYLYANKFQSTPPMRVATQPTFTKDGVALFQSTPPMRVATLNI